jgi:hypothetical protein
MAAHKKSARLASLGQRTTQARKKPTKKRAKKVALTAKTADKHALYEASVQDTSVDIAFIDRVYKKARGQKPTSLREDFCGTAVLCADWVQSHPERTATGLDLHAPTMAWGRKHHLDPLPESVQQRVTLLERDVIAGMKAQVDVAVAFNFSYCCFTTRAQMLAYMRTARRDLKDDGLFFMDIHGGTEVYEEMEESTRHKGFTYVWDQDPYDAITGLATRHIHFTFPDGSRIRPAFSYAWRLWSLPELSDILLEAGFSRVDVYWEGSDGQGAGNGKFRLREHADNELSWIAYIVAHA